jgi:hypothetical protein
MLLLLEDNSERVERFTATFRRIDPRMELRLWRDARQMIRELPAVLPAAQIISLDHDLEPEGSEDPGTGGDVALHLAALRPSCPVLIHSANSERAAWMMDLFESVAWECHRVPPLGDDWIEEDWRRLVRRLLKRQGDSSSK